MKLVFIPDPNVHSHEVAFPVRFVVSQEKSSNDPDLHFAGIPPVVVHADVDPETLLSVGEIYKVGAAVDGCLHVKCRVDQDDVVSLATKAALVTFSEHFLNYGVFAEFTLTSQL